MISVFLSWWAKHTVLEWCHQSVEISYFWTRQFYSGVLEGYHVELAPVAENRGGRWSLPSSCSYYTIKLEGNVDRFWCNKTRWELGETKVSMGFWISYSSSFFNLEVTCRIEESLGFLKKFLGTSTHSCCPAFCGWLPFSTLLENIFTHT